MSNLEYGLIAATISIVAVSALASLGQRSAATIHHVAAAIERPEPPKEIRK